MISGHESVEGLGKRHLYDSFKFGWIGLHTFWRQCVIEECKGVAANMHLRRLSFNPLARIRVRALLRWASSSSLVVPHTMMSSWELMHSVRFTVIEATSAWKTSLAECMSKGRRLKQYRPNGVPKVKKSALSSLILTCEYPDEASDFEKLQAPAISEMISSAAGKRWCCRLMALFRCRGSRRILRSPFGLDTMTRALT